MKDNNQIVVVLGMHRSGTSAITGTISNMGYYYGDDALEPTEENATGYFESEKIVSLNDAILQYNVCLWDDIENIKYSNCAYNDNLLNEGINIVKSMLNVSNKIIIKDPRLCLLLPFWNRVFSELEVEVKYVYIYRSLNNVTKSLVARDHFNISKSTNLWVYYNYFIFKNISKEMLCINYDELVNNSSKIINEVCDYLSIDSYNEESLINKKLRHHVEKDADNPNEFAKDINNIIFDKVQNQVLLLSDINELYKQCKKSFEGYLNSINIPISYKIEIFRGNDCQFGIIDPIRIASNSNIVTKSISLDHSEPINSLRIDPQDNAGIVYLKNAEIYNELGEKIEYTTITNSQYEYSNYFFFLKNDPQIVFNFQSQKIKSIYIEFFLLKSDISLLSNILYQIKNETDKKALENAKSLVNSTDNMQSNNENNNLNIINLVVAYQKKLSDMESRHKRDLDNLINNYNLLKKSNLFNKKYYIKTYSDVKQSNADPILHYLLFGYLENRKTSKRFSKIEYTPEQNGTDEIEINPLLNYIEHNKKDSKKFKIINPKISLTMSKIISYYNNFGIKQTLKRIYEKITEFDINKRNNSDKPYKFEEEIIPQEWLDIQRHQPLISIIIPIKNVSNTEENIQELINSIKNQLYKNYEVVFVCSDDDFSLISNSTDASKKYKIVVSESNSINNFNEYIDIGLKNISGDYFLVMAQDDIMSKNMLAHILECINISLLPEVIFFANDIFFESNEFILPFIKNSEFELNNYNFYSSACFSSNLIKYGCYIDIIIKNANLSQNKAIIDKVIYHKRVSENQWENDKTKLIAFYLPQFHEIKENNKWWGKGFTEWTNVQKAEPQFTEHYQKREAGELGYYDLVNDENIQRKQAQLAEEYNVFGFCYYYYWFNSKRLLEKPLDKLLSDKTISKNFCICWANENWTRRWDGLNQEILMEQLYGESTDKDFINDVIPIMKDSRYIEVDGKKLLLVYNAGKLPDAKNTFNTWREVCETNDIDIHIAVVKHKAEEKLIDYGCDSFVEFPPHGMNHENITRKVKGLNKNFDGGVYSYKYLSDSNVKMKANDDATFRGCMLQWDNTARRGSCASIFHDFSADMYFKWLYKCIYYTKSFNSNENDFVFINAWNEWAEGTYLEPDALNGRKMLEMTKKAQESR